MPNMGPCWRRICAFVLGASFALGPAGSLAQAPGPLNVEQCVAVALQQSARVLEAEAKVGEWRGRLREVEAVFYPKLSGVLYVAPSPRVEGSGYSDKWNYHYGSFDDWRPFTNLELLLTQPLYTFGRVAAGKKAARERIAVEEARVRETRNAVALEVRRMYYTHLFALSIQPALKQVIGGLAQAQSHAQELFEAATGDVTQVDLSKLTYGQTEASRYMMVAEDGAALSLAALRHLMGLRTEAPLNLADTSLPGLPPDEAPKSLATYISEAAGGRPEWAQVEHGHKAALALEDAERLAMWPTLFVAGQFHYAYTSNHAADGNPWHIDNFNSLAGGIALGLKIDLDPAQALAKVEVAKAYQAQVEALQRFAATGIPLQVRRAYDDRARARKIYKLSTQGVLATRNWMTFASTAYGSGTGEARDLLEGLVAYVQAKRSHYENLQAYYMAEAELAFAVGR